VFTSNLVKKWFIYIYNILLSLVSIENIKEIINPSAVKVTVYQTSALVQVNEHEKIENDKLLGLQMEQIREDGETSGIMEKGMFE
jgi:hypothetical protein